MRIKSFIFGLLLTSGAFAQSQVTYTESTATIANPSRGLQKYSITDNKYSTQTNYSNLSQTTLSGWRTGTDKVTVIFRYFMLDAFMSSNISQTYLNNIQKDFDIIRNSGLKCLVRFSYSDAQGSGAQQPTKSQILAHISQLSQVLTANKDVVFAFQAGFIGTWGEWYYTNSTEFGTDGTISTPQWANRKEIIEAMLAAVPAEVFVQVRYPLIKTKMYGTGKLNSTTAYQNTANARIGFFNDAFLNNWGDMGTFDVNSEQQTPVGTNDYTYLANETQYAPMTGETNGLNSPRTGGGNAVYEMDSTNWTCLNRDYHTDVWNVWINSGNYDEILRRLGYRFVLKSSAFNLTGNSLNVNINLDNKGFARIFTNRKAYLVLQSTGGANYRFELTSDPRTWNKAVTIQQTIDISSLPDGDYQSYLFLPDNNSSISARPEYAIRFANDNDVWQAATGFNKLSQLVKKAAPVNNPPVVSITAPSTGTTFIASANITISANATDQDGTIAKVEFYNGNTLLGTATTSPYTYSWTNVGAGTYTVTAKATDNSGASATSQAVTVKVNVNQAPVVSITATSPSSNTIKITATATDGDGSISKVEYYNGSTKVGTSTSSPYTVTLTSVPAGTHTITAVATDDKGGTTTSSAVTVTVSNPNQAPSVSITSPANNATYVTPANIVITVAASDVDGTIAKVEFYNGTTKLGESTNSPYEFAWNSVTAGSYEIHAVATDNKGASATSSVVTISVETATSVNDLSLEETLRLYPNPVQDILYFSKNAEYVVLSDIAGNVLETHNSSIEKLDLTGYSAGVYILQYHFKGNNYFYRVVKR